jgi:Arc/MetJ-type ribon-helix-helix transcriptional regulator
MSQRDTHRAVFLRLPEELMTKVDDTVQAAGFASRTDLFRAALERLLGGNIEDEHLSYYLNKLIQTRPSDTLEAQAAIDQGKRCDECVYSRPGYTSSAGTHFPVLACGKREARITPYHPLIARPVYPTDACELWADKTPKPLEGEPDYERMIEDRYVRTAREP